MFSARARFDIATEEPADFAASVIATAIRDAIETQGFDLGEYGVTVTLTPEHARANAPRLDTEPATA